jgi:HAD superfamily hydrolase (TIGR01484 family)
MLPLRELNPSACTGLLFDIDDTLTSHAALTADSYSALARLRAAGKPCIAVTGRPAGWCDLIARLWPVDAVVGENGAFYMVKRRHALPSANHNHATFAPHVRGRANAASSTLDTVWADTPPDIATHRQRLAAIAQTILHAVPGCALASDQAYRLCDLAIDFCEDVPPLPLDAAQRIAQLMTAQGMTAKISSIHVNGWFGAHDKLSTTLQLLATQYGQDAATAQRSWVYVGDSPNDAPMFAAFTHSVGVANVAGFGALLPAQPQYITPSESGAGFVELVNHWLNA